MKPELKDYTETQAKGLGLPANVVSALVEKESNGIFFWTVGSKQLPALNIEPQYFYRILKAKDGAKLATAVKAGLARTTHTGVPSGYEARYAMLQRMASIDVEAAYESVSFGAGQIMGENYSHLGYDSAAHMFIAAGTENGQIDQMLAFILWKPGLAAAVKAKDYTRIAYLYNGPGYKANHYDTDIKRLAETDNPSLVHASTWLLRVQALGFTSIAAFQTDQGLKPDGIAGKVTQAHVVAVEKDRQAHVAKPAKNAAVALGTGAAALASTGEVAQQSVQNSTSWLDTARPVIDAISSIGSYGPQIILVAVAAVLVGAVSYTVIRQFKERANA